MTYYGRSHLGFARELVAGNVRLLHDRLRDDLPTVKEGPLCSMRRPMLCFVTRMAVGIGSGSPAPSPRPSAVIPGTCTPALTRPAPWRRLPTRPGMSNP